MATEVQKGLEMDFTEEVTKHIRTNVKAEEGELTYLILSGTVLEVPQVENPSSVRTLLIDKVGEFIIGVIQGAGDDVDPFDENQNLRLSILSDLSDLMDDLRHKFGDEPDFVEVFSNDRLGELITELARDVMEMYIERLKQY